MDSARSRSIRFYCENQMVCSNRTAINEATSTVCATNFVAPEMTVGEETSSWHISQMVYTIWLKRRVSIHIDFVCLKENVHFAKLQAQTGRRGNRQSLTVKLFASLTADRFKRIRLSLSFNLRRSSCKKSASFNASFTLRTSECKEARNYLQAKLAISNC